MEVFGEDISGKVDGWEGKLSQGATSRFTGFHRVESLKGVKSNLAAAAVFMHKTKQI